MGNPLGTGSEIVGGDSNSMSSQEGIKVFLVVKDNKVVGRELDFEKASAMIGSDGGTIYVCGMMYTYGAK